MKLLAAEVEIAVFKAHLFRLVCLFVRNVDGGDFRGGLHHELICFDFDFACGKIGIDCVGSALLHFAGDGDHRLEVSLLDDAEEFAARVNDNLCKAVVVAKIHEENAAVVSEAIHPAGKFDGFARVRRAQFVARMGTIGVHNL